LELLIGAAMGLLSSVLYDGAYAAGRFVDDYLGVKTAMPAAAVAAGAEFGRLWSNAFLVVCVLTGGLEHLIILFMTSFRTLPLGYFPEPEQWLTYAIALPTLLVQAGILISGPMVSCVLLAQVSIAALGRVVPKLSTFALSFPIAYAVAIGVTTAALPVLLPLAAHPWFVIPFHAHG
jgi:flagellar biosynthetic protein FliR